MTQNRFLHWLGRLLRVLVTLAIAAAAIVLVVLLWQLYMLDPWTRDGRVRVEIVDIAPEVAGTVVKVAVHDNQFVNKGDVLFEIDPLRFRANLYVEGWPAWAEHDWAGRSLMVGWATAEVFKPIVRCAATDVDPTTAVRDIDLCKALFDLYGHLHCGVYVQVTSGGDVGLGDAATTPERVPE